MIWHISDQSFPFKKQLTPSQQNREKDPGIIHHIARSKGDIVDTTDTPNTDEPQRPVTRRGIARPPRVRRASTTTTAATEAPPEETTAEATTATEEAPADNGAAPVETPTENGTTENTPSPSTGEGKSGNGTPSITDGLPPATMTTETIDDVEEEAPPARRAPRPRSANGAQQRRRERPDRDRQDRERPQRPRPPANTDDGDSDAPRVVDLPEPLHHVTIPQLEALDRDEGARLAEFLGMPPGAALRRDEMVHRAIQNLGERGGTISASGILEITNDGYGFIRHRTLRHNINDVYVAQSQIRRFSLRTGDWVTGQVRSPKSGEKYYGLLRVDTVTGQEPEVSRRRPVFDQLTALFPDRLYDLETGQKAVAARLLNLIAPIGFGQRALIVSPPKAGKTILLHQIADAIASQYPSTHIMAALIGERPEEVTDWERTVKGAEVMASTFDEPVEEHTRVAELVLARAKRLVEAGQDVVILLDSITRLARAYNIAAPSSGRTLSGGMDPVALYPPKHFFGAARNTEESGTLTIVATCLVDTGSRLDDVIYEEFKGTGNMEVHLDRKLAERRIYPAIDVLKSGTRRDERLYDDKTYRGIVTLRRMMAMLSNSNLDASDATERILDRIAKTKTNADFMATLSREI